jgi:hypothetical protein
MLLCASVTKLLSYQAAKSTNAKHYFTGKPCARGHTAKRYTSTRSCFECTRSITGADWKAAYKQGVPFDRAAVVDYLKSAGNVCPALGIPLRYGGAQTKTFDSATLDRIRPELGYVRGNLALLSSRANSIKSDATAEEVDRVAIWLKQLQLRGIAHK